MLVLSRKLGEEIVIGDNIVLTVLSVRGKQVRLGILAPPDVAILRQEIRGQGEAVKPISFPRPARRLNAE